MSPSVSVLRWTLCCSNAQALWSLGFDKTVDESSQLLCIILAFYKAWSSFCTSVLEIRYRCVDSVRVAVPIQNVQ